MSAALPLLLFAIIFLWTPPHFWALSLFVRSDYAAAGIPMLPVVAGVAGARGGRSSSTACRWLPRRSRPGRSASPVRSMARRAAVLSFVFLVLAARVGSEPRDRARADGGREASVRLFGLLSVRLVRACSSRTDGLHAVKLEDEVVRRQRERARVTALLLGAFVVLLFFITIAKTGMNW